MFEEQEESKENNNQDKSIHHDDILVPTELNIEIDNREDMRRDAEDPPSNPPR
jgi:hypothetical protein